MTDGQEALGRIREASIASSTMLARSRLLAWRPSLRWCKRREQDETAVGDAVREAIAAVAERLSRLDTLAKTVEAASSTATSVGTQRTAQ